MSIRAVLLANLHDLAHHRAALWRVPGVLDPQSLGVRVWADSRHPRHQARRVLSGERRVTIDDVAAFAALFGVTPAEMMTPMRERGAAFVRANQATILEALEDWTRPGDPGTLTRVHFGPELVAAALEAERAGRARAKVLSAIGHATEWCEESDPRGVVLVAARELEAEFEGGGAVAFAVALSKRIGGTKYTAARRLEAAGYSRVTAQCSMPTITAPEIQASGVEVDDG